MFHLLWKDASGAISVAKERDRKDVAREREDASRCPSCPHGLVIHARHGGCHAHDCLCGWTRDAAGALRAASTGMSAAELSERRRRYRGASVGNGRRARILRNPCYFCGGTSETIDHFVPRAKGGTSEDSNLVGACGICNSLKSDRTYEELIAYCLHLRVMTSFKTALRKVILFQRYKVQAEKILARHEMRLKESKTPP